MVSLFLETVYNKTICRPFVWMIGKFLTMLLKMFKNI